MIPKDSAYIIHILTDEDEEPVQIFARNKQDMENVIRANGETGNIISTVQSLGAVEMSDDYIESLNNDDNNLNFGAEE